MTIDELIEGAITHHLRSLDFWRDYWERASVVVVGSHAAGLADEFSDVDVHVLVEHRGYQRLYTLYWEAVDHGAIRVLNPRARLFNEFPLVCMPGVDGHYQLKPFEEIEGRIQSMDDIARWIYSNSISITDPTGLHARIREISSEYPPTVLAEKRRGHRRAALDYYYGIKTQLRRNHTESLALLCVQSISHLLKYCCLCDGEPFPYEKWLYQVGIATSLGKQIKAYVDAILAETRRGHVVYEVPSPYVSPGDRSEEYEDYRLYHLFKLLLQQVDAFRADRFPEEIT
jgi:hypothetical protein